MKRYRVIILFLLYSVIASCSSVDSYSIQITDGVKYVTNHSTQWGDNPMLEIEFVQRIGILEGAENYMFSRPKNVTVDANGNIFILDVLDACVKKYDSNGKYLATIGSKGQGPGELENVLGSMQLSASGDLYVAMYHAISVLTSEGKEIKRIKMPVPPETFLLSSDMKIITTGAFKMNVSGKMEPAGKLLQINDQVGNFVKNFGDIIEYNDQKLNIFANILSISSDPSDNIYAVFSNQNRIEKYSPDGVLLFRAERSLNFEVGYEMTTRSVNAGGETVTFEAPQFMNVALNSGIDNKGRIWVQTFEKQKKEGEKQKDFMRLEVFDNEGILLCYLPLPENGDMHVISDKIFFIDQREEVSVFEYRIVEK